MLQIVTIPYTQDETLLFSSFVLPDTCMRVVKFSLSVGLDHISHITFIQKCRKKYQKDKIKF